MRSIIALAVVSLLIVAPAWPASAAQTLSSATWQAGPGASGDNTYAGGIDTPGNGAALGVDRLATVSGWFVDKTAQGWAGADDLQVFSGTMDSGTSLGHGTLGLPRSDVASAMNNAYWSAAGWSAVIDPGALPIGQNTLSIYLHTPGKGWWYAQTSVSVALSSGGVAGPALAGAGGPIVSVSAPLEGERISTRLGNYRVTGTARDPVAGAKAIDRVEVWLNGEHNTEQSSFIGDADVAPDGSWGIDFGPWRYPPITSNMYIYVHSDVTNKVTLVVVHFVLVDRPV
ncbi:MAG TPA: hypothetical protein VGJ60_00865 [Chloroflexota bacterium]